MIPSDREIPRSVNEGTPIVAAKERSEAAKAFNQLADRYTKAPVKAPTPLQVEEPKRTLLGRRR